MDTDKQLHLLAPECNLHLSPFPGSYLGNEHLPHGSFHPAPATQLPGTKRPSIHPHRVAHHPGGNLSHRSVDPALLTLWLLAVGTCGGGALLVGNKVKKQRDAAAAGSGSPRSRGSDDGEENVHLTFGGVLAFVVMSSVLLVCLAFIMSDVVIYMLVGLGLRECYAHQCILHCMYLNVWLVLELGGEGCGCSKNCR